MPALLILYGMEAWKKLSRVEIQNIEKIQGKALKGVFSLPITTPYIGLIIETGVWPAEQRINMALLHFRTPLLLLMTHHEKTQLKALFTVALTLTVGGVRKCNSTK